MNNLQHGLLAAERSSGLDSLDRGYFNFSVASSGSVSGLVRPPVAPAFIANVAHDDFFGTSEAAAFGEGLNVFADNGSGEDTGSDFAIAAVNGNAGFVGQEIALASGALLTLNADGTFFYDPNHAFDQLAGADSGATNHGATDTFSYTLTGGSTATVTIFVVGLDSNDTLIGSAEADHLFGGNGNDTIVGGGGNDVIDGGSGDNTAVFSGALGDYTVIVSPENHGLVVLDNAPEARDGIDTLKNIQHLQFSDATQTYTLDAHGQVETVATAFGDGSAALDEFDPSNQFPWAEIYTLNDSSGNLQLQSIYTDSGDHWTNEFGNGQGAPYLWETQHIDADGNLLQETTTFADGTHALTVFDVANQYGWADATLTFDAAWNITSFNIDPDAPAQAGAQFQNGRFTLADVQPALDALVWFATPFDPFQGGTSDRTLTGGSGDDTLYGFNGNDTISGGGGNDLIVGGRGNDTLSGGPGTDHFIFHAGDGADAITDFAAGARGDVIELRGYDVSSFEQLQGMMVQTDTDTMIVFDPQNSITLHNVDMSALTAGDFLFG